MLKEPQYFRGNSLLEEINAVQTFQISAYVYGSQRFVRRKNSPKSCSCVDLVRSDQIYHTYSSKELFL
jgi:hypothetical protein